MNTSGADRKYRSADRFEMLYSHLGEPVIMFEGTPWREYNRMVVPLGPVALNYSIDKEKAANLLAGFSRAMLVRCTGGFADYPTCPDWYAVLNDRFLEMSELSAHTRSKIRRGLKNCQVERVDAQIIADRGYDLYAAAHSRYRGKKTPPLSQEEYRRKISGTESFDDIVHYWGVFRQEKLLAYSCNHVFDGIEVNYSNIKFDPDTLRLYTSYALIYTMNRYYLDEMGIDYVNDGFRNILHETNIQAFLIGKFGFKKVTTDLHLFYRPYVSACLSGAHLLKPILGSVNRRLAALYKLDEIGRNCLNARVSSRANVRRPS